LPQHRQAVACFVDQSFDFHLRVFLNTNKASAAFLGLATGFVAR
jgi:hypothetical protein